MYRRYREGMLPILQRHGGGFAIVASPSSPAVSREPVLGSMDGAMKFVKGDLRLCARFMTTSPVPFQPSSGGVGQELCRARRSISTR
jgi:hypothetical protein